MSCAEISNHTLWSAKCIESNSPEFIPQLIFQYLFEFTFIFEFGHLICLLAWRQLLSRQAAQTNDQSSHVNQLSACGSSVWQSLSNWCALNWVAPSLWSGSYRRSLMFSSSIDSAAVSRAVCPVLRRSWCNYHESADSKHFMGSLMKRSKCAGTTLPIYAPTRRSFYRPWAPDSLSRWFTCITWGLSAEFRVPCLARVEPDFLSARYKSDITKCLHRIRVARFIELFGGYKC